MKATLPLLLLSLAANGLTQSFATDFNPLPHGGEATKAGLKADVLSKLDGALQRAVANHEISGVIGLIHRNGQRGYFESFGWQDIEARKPMPNDTIFRLKSMSKPVITVAALVLFDDGKFGLDDPISNHLPEWKEPKVSEGDKLVPARNPITPRMLMTHSSGLYYQIPGKPAFSGMPPRDENTTLEEYSRAFRRERNCGFRCTTHPAEQRRPTRPASD